MKKSILFTLSLLLGAAFTGCEPITESAKLGGVLNPSDIKISVEGVTPGSNSVVMYNTTPGVTGQWLDGKRIVGVGDRVPHLLRAEGANEVTFIALCDGGTVSTTITYNVERIDVIPPPLEFIAWQGNQSPGPQPKFPAEGFAEAAAGDTIRIVVSDVSGGWGQVWYADWSEKIMDMDFGKMTANKYEEFVLTQAMADKIKEVGLLMQGDGFTITKIIIAK